MLKISIFDDVTGSITIYEPTETHLMPLPETVVPETTVEAIMEPGTIDQTQTFTDSAAAAQPTNFPAEE